MNLIASIASVASALRRFGGVREVVTLLSAYRRPGGGFTYRRPDGISFYNRP